MFDTCHVLTPRVVFGKSRLIGLPVRKHVEVVVMHCELLDLLNNKNRRKIPILRYFKTCFDIRGEINQKKQLLISWRIKLDLTGFFSIEKAVLRTYVVNF